MKRQIAPRKYRVLDDPQVAEEYAASAARRGERIGRLLATLLPQMGFEQGRILDVGTGSGEVSVELARALPGADIVGLDLSGPLLEMARSTAEQAGLADRVSFEAGDAQAMPFEDNSFAAVVSVNALHVIDDPVAMLDEIERVLAPDGILLISTIKRSWLAALMPILKSAYTLDEAKDLLYRSNLRSWDFQFYDTLFWFSVSAVGSG